MFHWNSRYFSIASEFWKRFENEIEAKLGIDFGSIYKERIAGLDYARYGFSIK